MSRIRPLFFPHGINEPTLKCSRLLEQPHTRQLFKIATFPPSFHRFAMRLSNLVLKTGRARWEVTKQATCFESRVLDREGDPQKQKQEGFAQVYWRISPQIISRRRCGDFCEDIRLEVGRYVKTEHGARDNKSWHKPRAFSVPLRIKIFFFKQIA